ncbi:exocyst complex component 6-like isoform X11 [Tachypleus tridentatus]|uniref:exocyst complex component 6-like isoform X11 n=1 Tax=Tachypleus tridentatus TaxID=6853 RepID=UPI003FD5AC9C
MFANSEPVRGFEEGALQMCFADLRQLLDLFMTWDWSTYFHDYGQENSKYLRVNPQVAVVLLEKHILREVLTKIIAHCTWICLIKSVRRITLVTSWTQFSSSSQGYHKSSQHSFHLCKFLRKF